MTATVENSLTLKKEGISLHVEFDKPFFHPGDLVSGRVVLIQRRNHFGGNTPIVETPPKIVVEMCGYEAALASITKTVNHSMHTGTHHVSQSHNITAYYQRSCDLFLWGVEIPEEVWQPVSVSSVRDRYADLDHATIHEAIIPGYMLPSLLPAPYLSKEKVSFLGITQVTKRCGCQYIFRARFQGEGEMGTSDARSVRMSNIMIMAPIPIRGGTTQLGTNIPPIKPGYSPNEHVVSYEYGEGATLDVALVYRKFGKPKGIVRGLIRYNHHSAPEKLQSLIARTTPM